MTKKYKWYHKTISSYYCEVDTGKIVGKYSTIGFSDDVYYAEVNGDNLGEYISEKCACKAVEEQIAKNDRDNANLPKISVSR
jgi:hypothetical protein